MSMSKRIPFNIKYRPQIESGEYKVETRDGKHVRILCYDANNIVPIVALVTFNDGSEGACHYYSDGAMSCEENPLDLFIVTQEEELTPFEKELVDILKCLSGRPSEQTYEDYAKEQTAQLLSLAREQLKPDINFMMENNYKTAYKEGYDEGKKDALKDLPRWKKIGQGDNYWPETEFRINGRYLEMNDNWNSLYEISLKNLEKLPKEDEK